MRNIAILCLLLACALPALAGTYRADEIPNVQRMDRRRYVSDPDGILVACRRGQHIDSVCASLRERGLAQVAVVAVDDIAGGRYVLVRRRSVPQLGRRLGQKQ